MILCDKQVLLLKNQADRFLKDYSTNTPEFASNAFVDVKGRIVAVFNQLRLDADNTLIVIEKSFTDRVLKHLNKYLPLVETVVEKESYLVYFDPDGKSPLDAQERAIALRAGRLILTHKKRSAVMTPEAFTLFRLDHQMPLQGADFDEELLLNVADDEFVSYTKGCYLGQEIIARVHHRAKPPKKLVVCEEDDLNVQDRQNMTSKALDPQTGRVKGFLFVENKGEIQNS